jgi:multidrug efflux pump subunit AcrA (membrane-fusion protein)
MKKRQIIIVVTAIFVLLAGKLIKDFLANPPEKQKSDEVERIQTVFAEEVELKDIPIRVMTTGTLEAKDRMELYSEVQGLMLPDGGRFKAGNAFSKGQVLLSLRADDARARVVAQRSAFERLLSSVMADIKIDFPADHQTWKSYLESIDVNVGLPDLPEVQNENLKRYLTGRSIMAEFYNVRNAEIGLSRFTITAPFDGVLTSANVDPGTVVRPGQLLGVFVKPGQYELMAAVDSRTVNRLAKGQKVDVFEDGNMDELFKGSISRINASIDPQTQMSEFFVDLSSNELKEGQFMSIAIDAKTIPNAFEIDRSAIRDLMYVFIVDKGELKKVEIDILHTNEKTAVISGLTSGQMVLTKLPPAAFEGMKVKVFGESEAA